MHAYLHAAVREIFTNLDNRQRKYLLAAKKYVGEHYMDSTLSLDGTAAQLGISRRTSVAFSARSTENASPSTSATCASSRPSACWRTKASWCATSGRRSAS